MTPLADQVLHRLCGNADDPGLRCADCVTDSGPSPASSSSHAAARALAASHFAGPCFTWLAPGSAGDLT